MEGVLQSLQKTLRGIYEGLPGPLGIKEKGVNGKRLYGGGQVPGGLLRVGSLDSDVWGTGIGE